ncbi:16898_t:CDS:2, partial [Racocetra persica]
MPFREFLGSENTLVEIIAHLIDIAILPVDYDVKVTRSEYQSIASKNQKVQQKKESRGNKPDLMFRAYLCQKWKEIVFFENGSKELVKKCTKEVFHQNYIGFGVNIAADTQYTIVSLRELNTKLIVEISELRKKYAELEAKNIKVEAENAKLKQDKEEEQSLQNRGNGYTDNASDNAEYRTSDSDIYQITTTITFSILLSYISNSGDELSNDRDFDSSEVKIQVSIPDDEDFNYDYNDEDFSDNNNEDDDKDDESFCGFSDDNKDYYYDLNTGETYTKSEH